MTLTSQLLRDSVNISGSGIAAVKVTELDHRSSEVMLLKCEVHVCQMTSGSAVDLAQMRLVVLSKPRSEGVPVAGDADDERYVVHQNCAFSSRNDANSQRWASAEHMEHSIKIRVPLTNDVWVLAVNDEAVTLVVRWVLRLFWLMI